MDVLVVNGRFVKILRQIEGENLKKVIMESDKVLEHITMIKSIIKSLNEQLNETLLEDNIVEKGKINSRLKFMTEQLKDLENRYEQSLTNDKPYYISGTLEYYRNIFEGRTQEEIDTDFIIEVIRCIESDHVKQKFKSIKNIVECYNSRNNELLQELKKRLLK